jgi:hypothetical protein
MFSSIRTVRLAAVVAAAVALTVTGAGPAQSAPGGDKGPGAASPVRGGALAPDRSATARLTPRGAAEALATIQARIARYVAANGTRYTFGSYLDQTTGRIVVDTDAPANLVSALTTMASPSADQALAVSRVQVRRNGVADTFNRRDDSPPFWGGGGIRSGSALCSSGYTVRNAAGTRFMITAGHCFANGATVRTESGARVYGTVSGRRLPTVTGGTSDLEQVGGQSYAGRVFTGGVTSSTSIPVVAAGTAYVGYTNYCHSGRTTGEQCGHTANSITAQVCTATGCKSPVIAYTGGTVQQGGDSGGAFYADARRLIRGHVIAGNP